MGSGSGRGSFQRSRAQPTALAGKREAADTNSAVRQATAVRVLAETGWPPSTVMLPSDAMVTA